jgi:peptide-methionine (R)-S-oxide reductase
MAKSKMEMTDQQWRSRLTPAQYEVLRRSATEPPWSGALLHVDDDGVFRCAGCGTGLFRTDDKFESGSGWPSFDRALADGLIDEHVDRSHGMVRTEVTCATCGGHLGHLFPDGPTETGMRYCVNSLALTFDAGDEDTGDEDTGDEEDRAGSATTTGATE